MKLTASDLHRYLRPVPCELRVYLHAHGEPAGEAGPFAELLFRLGMAHEHAHLATLGAMLDLSGIADEEEAVNATKDAVAQGVPLVYQAALRGAIDLHGATWEVAGRPDFLIATPHGYGIRDAKLSRRIADHPEITAALQLYGWLWEQQFGSLPAALEIAAGDGSVVDVVRDDAALLRLLADVAQARLAPTAPYSPVGSSKCEACAYTVRCWEPAVQRQDVAILPDVDQGLARELHGLGVTTIEHLSAAFDTVSLAALERPWGSRRQKVGKAAESIMRHVDAWQRQDTVLFGPLAAPVSSAYVMFDLEGLPPFQQELDQIYLWGFQVFADAVGPYVGVGCSPGANGDEHAWAAFLAAAQVVLAEVDDAPWVHWGSYEKTYLRRYRERYGDPDGIAARVERNLFDLLPATKKSMALPVTGYGLKAVEKHVGFHRTQDEYGGAWSIARYIEALAADDDGERAELLEEIRTYNAEDLEAMWAVFSWVRQQSSAIGAT